MELPDPQCIRHPSCEMIGVWECVSLIPTPLECGLGKRLRWTLEMIRSSLISSVMWTPFFQSLVSLPSFILGGARNEAISYPSSLPPLTPPTPTHSHTNFLLRRWTQMCTEVHGEDHVVVTPLPKHWESAAAQQVGQRVSDLCSSVSPSLLCSPVPCPPFL